MATSPRTRTAPSRRGRPPATPAPSIMELRDAVKAASLRARSTRQDAKEAAGELKRLASALEKARKSAAREKAAGKPARMTGKAVKAAGKAVKAAGKASAPAGKVPKAAGKGSAAAGSSLSRGAPTGNGQHRRTPAVSTSKTAPRRGRPPKATAVTPTAIVAA
jgi:hypothetical protein